RAMIRPGAEEEQRTSVKAKRRDSITDTFLRFRRYGTNCAPNLLKDVAMIRVYTCEVLINCLRLLLDRLHHYPGEITFPYTQSLVSQYRSSSCVWCPFVRA